MHCPFQSRDDGRVAVVTPLIVQLVCFTQSLALKGREILCHDPPVNVLTIGGKVGKIHLVKSGK